MSRYLNLSELTYVRHRATELVHRRRPRRAGRVRAYAPAPRRPLDTAPLDVLHAVLAGLHRLDASA